MSKRGGRGWDSLIQGALETLRHVHDAGSGGLTVDRLCSLRGVARSTIYRDLGVARRAGWDLRVHHDRREGNRAYYWIPTRAHEGGKRYRVGDEDLTLSEIAERAGTGTAAIYRRMAAAPDDPQSWVRPIVRRSGAARYRVGEEMLTSDEIAKRAGASPTTIRLRIRRHPDRPDLWLRPPHKVTGCRDARRIEHGDIRDTKAGWARRLGISASALHYRMVRHPDEPEAWFRPRTTHKRKTPPGGEPRG